MNTHPVKRDFNKVALQLYWKRTFAWVSSCKFAVYFQNTFYKNIYGGVLLTIKRNFRLVGLLDFTPTLILNWLPFYLFMIFICKFIMKLSINVDCHKDLQVFIEFAKSRAMRAMRASVVYVSTCRRANVPKAWQLLIFTWQRVNKRANVPKCKRRADFST